MEFEAPADFPTNPGPRRYLYYKETSGIVGKDSAAQVSTCSGTLGTPRLLDPRMGSHGATKAARACRRPAVLPTNATDSDEHTRMDSQSSARHFSGLYFSPCGCVPAAFSGHGNETTFRPKKCPQRCVAHCLSSPEESRPPAVSRGRLPVHSPGPESLSWPCVPDLMQHFGRACLESQLCRTSVATSMRRFVSCQILWLRPYRKPRGCRDAN